MEVSYLGLGPVQLASLEKDALVLVLVMVLVLVLKHDQIYSLQLSFLFSHFLRRRLRLPTAIIPVRACEKDSIIAQSS